MPEEKVSLTNQQVAHSPGPGEQGFVMPAASVPLPSLGKVYPAGHKLADRHVVDVRAMTARDEDILTSRALIKSGKVMDVLLKSCIVDRDINVNSMLSGDRNACLIAIRITGYGQAYNIEVECPACAAKYKHEFDLALLPIKPLTAVPTAEGRNEFAFVLPVLKKTVLFKLLTGDDERELSMILEQTRKASGGAESLVTTRIFHQTISIGGETDRNKLAAIVRNMPAQDSRALRKYMNEISPDVEMKQDVTCPQCDESYSLEVPMGTEFFWPST